MNIKQAEQFAPRCYAVTPAEDMGDPHSDYWLWWNDEAGSTHVTRVVLTPLNTYEIVPDEEPVVTTTYTTSRVYIKRRNSLREHMTSLDEQMDAATLADDTESAATLHQRVGNLEIEALADGLARPAPDGTMAWRSDAELFQRAKDEGIVAMVTHKR